MVGNFVDQDKKAFRNLLRLDVFRGEHSTGVAVVERVSGDIKVYKKVGAPDLLFQAYEDFDVNGVYDGKAASLFIGHNRWATKGKITDENAHPFHHNSVVGAHNGTLDSVYHLEDGHKFDVDSEAIFFNLDKYDAVDTIGNIEGAYALTWYDANENKLKIIRNNERPLHWTRRKDMDVIYWASCPWMLHIALDYANINHGDIHDFEKDTLYTFDLDSVAEGKVKDEKWLIKRGVTGHEPSWKKYTVGGNWDGNYGGYGHGGGNKTTKIVTNTSTQGAVKSNVSPFKAPSSSNSSVSSSTSSVNDLSREEQIQWGAWEGKEIDFRFLGKQKGVSGIEYLAAYPDNPMLQLNIRVFANGKPQCQEWMSKLHTTTFTGKVKRFVRMVNRGSKENYLAIDLRTIKEKPTKAEPKEGEQRKELSVEASRSNILEKEQRWYEGYKGAFLSHREWQTCTQHCCEGCSQNADEDDEELTWLSEDSFLCGTCSKDDEYKDYIQSAYA